MTSRTFKREARSLGKSNYAYPFARNCSREHALNQSLDDFQGA